MRKLKKDKKFDSILDECLERILVNGETIEQCLERYPEYAVELEPLLLTATATSEAVDVAPSLEFKARARYQLRVEMASLDEKKKKRFFLVRQPRWAVAVVTALVVLLVGSGTVLAANSEDTIPGNPLYTVKLATENVRLALTSSDAAKAELYATLVDRRTAEIERLIDRGKAELVERTVARLKSHLANIANLAPSSQAVIGPEIAQVEPVAPEESSVKPDVAVQDVAATVRAEERVRLQVLWGRYIVNHPDEIRAMLEKAPQSIKEDLTKAIVASVNSYVAACQKALRESNQSQNGENSDTPNNGASNNSNQQPGTSDTESDTSGQQSGASDRESDTSNQQPGTSSQQSGNSSLAPDASDPQSGNSK